MAVVGLLGFNLIKLIINDIIYMYICILDIDRQIDSLAISKLFMIYYKIYNNFKFFNNFIIFIVYLIKSEIFQHKLSIIRI